MKKFLLLLVAGVAILWGLDRLGVVKLPFTGADVVQTAQRTFGGRRAQQRNEAVPVLTSPARREDVPVTLDAVGTVQALNTVVVRAQVEGRLIGNQEFVGGPGAPDGRGQLARAP